MKMNKKQLIKKYYNSRAACQVLGCLLTNPELVKSKELPISQEDFANPLHQLVFGVAYDLAHKGVKTIRLVEIENHLSSTSPISYERFMNQQGSEWVQKVLLLAAEVGNYEHYYWIVRKLSCLRAYLNQGVDVSGLLDYSQVDPTLIEQQEEKFFRLSMNDIIRYFDRKNLNAKELFVVSSNEGGKIGEGARELRQKLKESPPFGYSFESEYLNTLAYGLRIGALYVESRNSGCGKSRIGLKRLVLLTAPQYWCHEKNCFINNPQGQDNRGLYINTELEKIEIETIVWATISGLPEDKIIEDDLTKEEEVRLNKAIEIAEQMKLWMETEENYDVAYLRYTIDKYKTKWNINMVVVDYIELTPALVSEYVQQTKGMVARGDSVLLNLSAELKTMARQFKVVMIAYTQVSDNARRDETIRDSSAIANSKSIQNKADFGAVVFEPSVKELEKVQPIIESLQGFYPVPNIIYHIYKIRKGKIKNCKVFAYQDLGTMRVIDCFVTNDKYEQINVDRKKIVRAEEEPLIPTHQQVEFPF